MGVSSCNLLMHSSCMILVTKQSKADLRQTHSNSEVEALNVSIWSGRLVLWDSFSCVHTDLLSVASGSFWTISCILLHTVLRRKMPTCNNMHFVLNQGNMVMNVYDSSLSWSKNLNGYKSEVTLFSTSQLNLMSSCWAQHTIKGWF